MSGGGKGGKQTTEVKIPEWLEGAARTNMARADEIAKIGPVPYYGIDFAGFTPMQQAAFQNTSQAARAFGQAAPQDPMAGMPQAQTYAGGIQGYSSGSLYDQALAELQRRAPAQFAALQAPFINPQTGAQPAAPFGAAANLVAPTSMGAQVPMAGGGGMYDGGGSYGGGQGFFNTHQGPNMNGQAGYGAGGFTSFGDMFDGGGPGASGGSFQGGGAISSIGNAVGRSSEDSSGPSGMGGGK